MAQSDVIKIVQGLCKLYKGEDTNPITLTTYLNRSGLTNTLNSRFGTLNIPL